MEETAMKSSRILVSFFFVGAFFLSACGVVHVVPKLDDPDFLSEKRASGSRNMVASISPSLPPSPIERAVVSDYILGAEDVIEVLVWKNVDLSKTVFVRPDGKISLPLIGDVQAAGLTPNELRDSIKALLRKYKKTPEVSVIIRAINSFSIFLVGEIASPGKIQLRSDTTLLQAIVLAGGFTEFADVKKILVLRRENGQERRFRINYNDIVSGRGANTNILLKRGDTILVP